MAGEKSTTQVMACIFFGVAFGALIGSRLQEVSLWAAAIAGGMLGALIGVLVFAFEDIKLWAPVAWKRASGWKWPNKEAWKIFFLLLFAESCILSSFFVLFFLLAFIFPAPQLIKGEEYFSLLLPEFSQSAFYFAYFFISMIASLWIFGLVFMGEIFSPSTSKTIIKYFNPIVMYGWYPIVVLKYILKGLEWLSKRIPMFFCLIGRFLKQLGICIYSDALVLVLLHTFVGGAIGALVGSVLHILIIAALFSGLGGLQYQFISKPYFLKPSAE